MGAPGGRGRVAARMGLALLVVLGCAALSGAAARSATGPVPYVSLHLGGSSATFSVPSWSLSASGCQFGEPGTSQSFDATLSAGSGGVGVLELSFSGGSMSSSVSSPGAKEIQLDLTGGSGNGAGSYELKLTGYGTSFTGSATLSDPTCTYSSSSATLSLAGTGLTIIDEKVAVTLDPDKVNVCTSSCTSVLVKATVTDADTGEPISGHSVSFSSSDPKVEFGSVTDRGDGTYTASLHPSDEPGDVTITATDTSAFGDPSGNANLEQDCQPKGSAVHAAGYVRASAAAAKHCTVTTVVCSDSVDSGVANRCVITVTDTTKHPTRPTGKLTITTWTPGLIYGQNKATAVCPLSATPGHSAKSAGCVVDIDARPGAVDVLAQYGGDAHHTDSLRAVNYTVKPAVSKLLPLHKDLTNVGITLQVVGGTTILAGKVEAGTGVGVAPGAATIGAGEVEAAGGTILYYLGNWLGDPPDRAYRTVAVPHIPPTPDVPAGSSPLAVTARAFLANQVAMAVIGPALHKALDRAVSAAKAENWKARTAQAEAAAKYLDRLAGLVDSDITVQQKLAALLRSAHLDTFSASKSRLQSIRASLVQHLPADIGRLFKSLGVSTAQFQKTLAALHISGKQNIAAALASPGLVKAEKAIAAGLRLQATDPAPDAYPTPAVLP